MAPDACDLCLKKPRMDDCELCFTCGHIHLETTEDLLRRERLAATAPKDGEG